MRSIAGLPFLLQEDHEIAIVPPQIDAPRSAVVESIRYLKDDSYLVNLDTVSDIDTAEALVGCYFLVDRASLPEDFDTVDEPPFVGFRIRDVALGELGQVFEFIEGPHQSRLNVRGPSGEFTIPFVDEFITDVNENAKTISTSIPAGLIDLALRESKERDHHEN